MLTGLGILVSLVVPRAGPLLFGVRPGATGGWALPLAVLYVAVALTLLAGWPATARRTSTTG